MKYEEDAIHGLGFMSVAVVLLILVSLLLYLIRGPEHARPAPRPANSNANDNPFLEMGKGTGKHGL